MRKLNMHARFKMVRSAFTLVEMLVVIAIIAVLAAMTAVGVSKVVSSQRSTNTQNAMRTIQKVMNEHWAYVVAEAKKETGVDFGPINTIFGNDPTGGERNRMIWIKMRLMEAFPVKYKDVQSPYPYITNPIIIPLSLRKNNATYQKALGARMNDKLAGATESSACLLLALSITRNGTSLNFDNLGSTSIGDTDGDGIQELIDAWGNPLTFYRFPTNWKLQNANPGTTNPAIAISPSPYFDPSPYSANSPYGDPLDPKGTLLTGLGAKLAVFETNVHKIAFTTNYTNYILPTIVSWGPDGNINALDINGNPAPAGLGLDKNGAVVDPVQEADNLYSFLLR